MHGAKEGGREVFRERVRERKGKRERDGEWEKSTQFGEGSINGPSNRERVGLMLKLDELLWPLMTFVVIHIHNIGIHINFYQNRFISESFRKNFLKFP